jgi:(4S)-4-hydroxy-5-phosphonooxypentane-2,3-dione isomerase
MQQVLLVEFRIAPPHIEAFDAAIRANAAASLAREPGCRLFDVCRAADDPALFVLYEIYDDEPAVQAHLAAAHFRAFDAATAGWVLAKSVRRLLLPAHDRA